jgi:hypothetical protein
VRADSYLRELAVLCGDPDDEAFSVRTTPRERPMGILRRGDEHLHYCDSSHRWVAPEHLDQLAWDAGMRNHLAEHRATMGGQAKDGQVRDGQVRDGQVRDGQVRDGQVRDGQVRDGSARDGSVNGGERASCPVRVPRQRDHRRLTQRTGGK